MKTYILVILILLLTSILSVANASVVNIMVFFKDIAPQGDTIQTVQLILKEIPDYPVKFTKTPEESRILMQLYKDGGDGIISPLDSLGNPTGDDIIITHASHLWASQGIQLAIRNKWVSNGISFYPSGDKDDAWQGDSVYFRIFNAPTIKTATKYIVSHSLYTVPNTNTVLTYVPTYGWDKKGWVKFR